MSFKIRKILLIIYIAALSAFAPFSTDIYLASMPTIQHEFNTSATEVQLTLSLFFICFAIVQLLWGPLSDRMGRKKVIFISIIIFIIGSQLCAHSMSISQLIISRIIQAFGACAGMVMAMAIIKDRFPDHKEMATMLSIMTSISILAPMIAPTIGSYLLTHFGWRSNFYFLSVYGAILIACTFITTESFPKAMRTPLPINKLCHAYIEQMKQPFFLLATLAISANFSVMFAFISASPFIYITIYHLPTRFFGYLFAVNASALTCGSLSLKFLKKNLTDYHVVRCASVICIVGALLMIIWTHIFPSSMLSVVIGSFIVTYGVGILYPELTAYALKNVVTYTGLASSIIGTARFILAAIVGLLMGMTIVNNALPLAITMLALSIVTALFMSIYFRRCMNT